jgi:hypothetical protein
MLHGKHLFNILVEINLSGRAEERNMKTILILFLKRGSNRIKLSSQKKDKIMRKIQ